MNIRQRLTLSVSCLLLMLGSVALAHADVTVTSADPAEAPQGTVSLDVTIAGNGFDSSAQVQFLVTGTTNPGGITVKKVTVRGSKKLIATIDIADTAVVDKFDIQVALSDGRKGKGTTLFAVQLKPNADPCARPGLDFPAFMYWQNTGSSKQLFVADATGVCSRAVVTTAGANGAAFSYPVAGSNNVGRVVFPGNGTIDSIDFTVNHLDNSIVLGASTPLFDNWNLGGFELSPDGTTVYYSVSPGSPQDFATLYKVSVGDPQSSQQIYKSLVAGASLETPTISADGLTLVTELVASSPELHQILRISLPCGDVSACTIVLATSSIGAYWPTLNPIGTTVAYSDFLSGYNSCYQIRVIDAATGTGQFVGTQPRYGTQSSWFGGQLLVNGRKPPDRKGTCRETGMVTLIDPATGAETPLVSGYGPDGR